MPQLDLLNWYYVVNVATWACGILVVYLIKYTYFTWRKMATTKAFLTFIKPVLAFQNVLVIFLRISLRNSRLRKLYLTQLVTNVCNENSLRSQDYDKKVLCEISH